MFFNDRYEKKKLYSKQKLCVFPVIYYAALFNAYYMHVFYLTENTKTAFYHSTNKMSAGT